MSPEGRVAPGGNGELEAVCIGETMAMVTPARTEPLEEADGFALRAGGAESNVAMYLAGLGHRVGWVSRLGNDPLGRRVLREVSAAGVDTALVELDEAAPTGVFFKDPGRDVTRVYYYRANSAASLMDLRLLAPVLTTPPLLVHLTGITPALSASCDSMISQLLVELAHGATTVSFDVNFREGLWPPHKAAPRLLELAQEADVVFVGFDEANTLWGVSTPEELRALMDRPGFLVVKDGGVGATVLHAQGREFVPALEVEVHEPVGAGDAFAAGWLSGLLRGLPHAQRLRLGHLLASLALSSTADHLALPAGEWQEAALAATEAEWVALRPPGQDPRASAQGAGGAGS